ncbi:MAG: hypothetical protein H0U92_06980 [Actinobacteria bacterium]|nr:hypothetical protein [Actinomycetota bacterium]
MGVPDGKDDVRYPPDAKRSRVRRWTALVDARPAGRDRSFRNDAIYTPRQQRLNRPYGYRVNNQTRSKYAPLRGSLEQHSDNAVRMTFREIEDVLGFQLPDSARRYAFWWANDRTGNHVQAAAWMAAGRHVARVDLVRHTVMFVRASRNYAQATTIHRFG